MVEMVMEFLVNKYLPKSCKAAYKN